MSFTLGASGAVVSVTFPFPDSDLLPDISVSVAVISLPTFNSVPSGTSTVQLPFSSTLLVAVFPSGNVTVTVFPTSCPFPDTFLLPTSVSFTLGASGAVVSVTFPFPDSDLLPDISVSVAVISLPTFNSVPSGTSTVQLPFSSTLLVAVFPSGNVTVTVFPTSCPFPDTFLLPTSVSFTLGASGAVVSVTFNFFSSISTLLKNSLIFGISLGLSMSTLILSSSFLTSSPLL
uniref:Uncharacterized protein n=1 Tax=Staphylococcus aureus TaxID=1280 RepID=D2JAS8_STAAU|nr:hypothetical protein SAP078A_001 [Staphylococcus aureus]